MVKIIIGGSCHKYQFCRDKRFVVTKLCLSRQTLCRDKHMLYQNACRDKQVFVATEIFCRDKHNFVATKMILVAMIKNDRNDRK